MSTASRGNAAENFVVRDLESKGFLVGSRRHIGGAGDLLAVRPDGLVWLVEVKKCKELWQQFRRADRQEMRDTPLPPGGKRWAANVRGSGEKRTIRWAAESEWPT